MLLDNHFPDDVDFLSERLLGSDEEEMPPQKKEKGDGPACSKCKAGMRPALNAQTKRQRLKGSRRVWVCGACDRRATSCVWGCGAAYGDSRALRRHEEDKCPRRPVPDDDDEAPKKERRVSESSDVADAGAALREATTPLAALWSTSRVSACPAAGATTAVDWEADGWEVVEERRAPIVVSVKFRRDAATNTAKPASGDRLSFVGARVLLGNTFGTVTLFLSGNCPLWKCVGDDCSCRFLRLEQLAAAVAAAQDADDDDVETQADPSASRDDDIATRADSLEQEILADSRDFGAVVRDDATREAAKNQFEFDDDDKTRIDDDDKTRIDEPPGVSIADAASVYDDYEPAPIRNVAEDSPLMRINDDEPQLVEDVLPPLTRINNDDEPQPGEPPPLARMNDDDEPQFGEDVPRPLMRINSDDEPQPGEPSPLTRINDDDDEPQLGEPSPLARINNDDGPQLGEPSILARINNDDGPQPGGDVLPSLTRMNNDDGPQPVEDVLPSPTRMNEDDGPQPVEDVLPSLTRMNEDAEPQPTTRMNEDDEPQPGEGMLPSLTRMNEDDEPQPGEDAPPQPVVVEEASLKCIESMPPARQDTTLEDSAQSEVRRALADVGEPVVFKDIDVKNKKKKKKKKRELRVGGRRVRLRVDGEIVGPPGDNATNRENRRPDAAPALLQEPSRRKSRLCSIAVKDYDSATYDRVFERGLWY